MSVSQLYTLSLLQLPVLQLPLFPHPGLWLPLLFPQLPHPIFYCLSLFSICKFQVYSCFSVIYTKSFQGARIQSSNISKKDEPKLVIQLGIVSNKFGSPLYVTLKLWIYFYIRCRKVWYVNPCTQAGYCGALYAWIYFHNKWLVVLAVFYLNTNRAMEG